MDAVEALGLLRSLGLTLTADAGRLIVQPAELLDDDVRWLIRKHRGEIFQIVTTSLPTEPTKGASDGFVGTTPGLYENIHAENDADETGNEEGLIFEKVAIPLPTKPSKGVDRVASDGEPPKPVLSPSGLWCFTAPLGSPKYHGEPTATRGEPRKRADMKVEF